MKNRKSFFPHLVLFILLWQGPLQAQPTALHPGITVQKLMQVKHNAVRVVFDRFSGSLHYNTSNGSIYRLLYKNGQLTDSLLYTSAQHGIQYLMGFIMRDSFIYLAGNNAHETPYTVGLVVRGVRKANGSCVWTTVVSTEPYPTAGVYDHMVSGLALNAAGDTLLFSNGARGDHGEVETRNGQFPGLRNPPITTLVFTVPSQANGLLLKNDSAWLAGSPYVFAAGDRNFFDMAFCANGDLFALENSGDRDHNEEMNWLRRGHHYGFPWVMGETVNIMQFPGYDISKDKMLAINSWGRSLGIFKSDSSFPPPPPGVVFSDPVINMGPDADKFRDSVTGLIHDASDMGIGLKTFTAHRSPLGLVFDNDSALAAPFTGHAFAMGYSKGLDSAHSFPPNNYGGPFLDPSEDILHLELEKDLSVHNYRMHCTRIVGGFHSPVDADLQGNVMYVIENEWDSSKAPALWQVNFPGRMKSGEAGSWLLYPNPVEKDLNIQLYATAPALQLQLFNALGQLLSEQWFRVQINEVNNVKASTAGIESGACMYRLYNGQQFKSGKLLFINKR